MSEQLSSEPTPDFPDFATWAELTGVEDQTLNMDRDLIDGQVVAQEPQPSDSSTEKFDPDNFRDNTPQDVWNASRNEAQRLRGMSINKSEGFAYPNRYYNGRRVTTIVSGLLNDSKD